MSNKNILLTRAARHIALPQIGEKGQKKIERSTILIIGIGGIGCAASSYLASSGVGQIILCDFDIVDETNLGRQILYGPDDVGKLKTLCATKQLKRINPSIKLSTIPKRLDDEELITIISNCNVVLDCSDNFSTRFQINSACVSLGKYLISGSAIRFEAQLAIFGNDYNELPCYRCLYNKADETLENCAGNGILSALPGVVGSLMAVETLKLLSDNYTKASRLMLYEGLTGEWRELKIKKRFNCPICS